MMTASNLNTGVIGFNEVAKRVHDIAETEKTEVVTSISQKRVTRLEGFTEYGFQMLGKTVGFPAKFVQDIAATNQPLAIDIIKDRVSNYFAKGKRPFYTRDFLGKTAGVVSDRYSYFDDKQVVDILDGSPLTEMKFQNVIITPERFHLRAIDADASFKVANDPSELFFAYFVDNSMVGRSSFKVQIGVYRLACTNGMILPAREFILCKQIHLGRKDIAAEFNESVAFLESKRDSLKETIMTMANEQSAIEELKADFHKEYLQKKLNLNQKEAEKVLELYNNVYVGRTRWDMANAITEFARDLTDINRREYIERAAFKAA